MMYQNYHKHTHISNIIVPDSVVTNEDYCKRAVELGHSIISSCEHGTQGDYRECATLAEKYGLRWRYVTEAYFVIDRLAETDGKRDTTNAHMILAAKTEKGIGDLNELLSEANMTGYYGRPRIDLQLLMELDPADVFITTACLGGVFKYGFDEAERIIRTIESRFHGSFMLEVQNHNTDKQKEVNRFLLRMYRQYGIPLIMGVDSHYIYPEDAEARDKRLEANGLHYDDEDGFYMDYPSDDEAYERFVRQGVLPPALIREAMENTNVFLTFEDVKLDRSKKLPTIYPDLTQEERNEKYRQLVRERWEAYKGGVSPVMWDEYEAGIQYEVDTITSTNMSDYFLLDYELVRRGKELGGMLTYTGRGSGPSYFTNTLLGFSSVDRFALPVTMYPDRFISKDRLLAGNLPDLDLNCGDVAPFAQAQAEVMGEWRSAPMIAFGTMKRSAAWKMYCRANDVPFDVANAISESLKEYEEDCKYADETEREDIDARDYVPSEFHEYLLKSESYLGVINSISPHPCAYLLCQKDIRREIGIYRINSGQGSKKKVIYAAFITGATAEAYGYLKNDLLKVTVVKVNAEVYKRAGIPQPSVPELLELTRGDQLTWDMYAKGYTLGLNQAEKPKSTEKVMRYKPKNISEMSAFVAGIRPAFQSMINTLLERRHFSYGIPSLDKLLQTPEMPDSFILYQEQMMKVLQYGSFTPPESYSSIKAIAKKHPEKVLPLKERFLKGFASRLIADEGVSEDVAEKTSQDVWTIISDACGYGFNSCLTGDTKIVRPDCGNGYTPTIAEMYLIRNSRAYAEETGHLSLHKKYRRHGYGKALSLCEDSRVRENQIVDIRYAGTRTVYAITTSQGRTVRCTDNHKFPIGSYDNLVEAKELSVGDELFVRNPYKGAAYQHPYSDGDASNLPTKGQRGFQHNPNGGSVLFKKRRTECVEKKLPCSECGVEYSEKHSFELHHADGDSRNSEACNLVWLCNSCHKKTHYRLLSRNRRMDKGQSVHTEAIVSIQELGTEDVYDVEMADPYHNFVLDNSVITGNSHSVSVACDSLYGAYAKAHHPYEFYATLMENYSEKGDKTRISQAKVEMAKAFGIHVAPCRFRQDNRGFYIDKANHSISDSLTSVKHISMRVAEALYHMRDGAYPTFVDLLVDLTESPAFTSQSITVLIKSKYFAEFGGNKKLLDVYQEFREGKNRYSKALKDDTKEKRLNALRLYEAAVPDEELPFTEQMAFETAHYNVPISTYKELAGNFVVLDVDEKFSPKLRMYNVASGTVGVMKVKKALYKQQPVQAGNVIHLGDWIKSPASYYAEGRRMIRPGVFDLWIRAYEIIGAG